VGPRARGPSVASAPSGSPGPRTGTRRLMLFRGGNPPAPPRLRASPPDPPAAGSVRAPPLATGSRRPAGRPSRCCRGGSGSAGIVSHDRWFLDRLATRGRACEGDARGGFFDGNATEYEGYRRDVLDLKALDPHRIKYRKLTR
jgi:hypothetical protein